MSESANYYMSWLGCNSFGVGTVNKITIAPPVVFSPTDISDCSVWFDATDNLTITTSGNNITSWFNKGDLSGSMVPYPGEAAPTTNVHTMNGNNVVWFDMYQVLYQNMQFTNQEYTFFVVTNVLADPASQNYVSWFSSYTYGGFGTTISEYLGDYYTGCGASAVDNVVMNSDTSTVLNTPLIYVIRSSSNTAQNVILRNNVSLTLNVASKFVGYNNGAIDFYMHQYTHTSSYDVGELIVYNRVLTDEEVLTVNTYLADKFSITI